uniref:HTH_Tnp_Tc3_2 domain-containing protein n=1 Tax=Caenorhabditis japonica TaxID=281687 RepID=A0A8R1HUX9_CAEJA
MGRGKPLTDYEQGLIDANPALGMSNRRIAVFMGSSINVVNNYIKDPLHYDTKKSPGRPSLLLDRDKRNIVRKTSNAVTSCAKIKSYLGLNVFSEAVRLVLKKRKFIKHRKMKKAPFLTAVHKQKRLEFARKSARTDWRKVIFSDEKKFNCDGPGGYRSYWQDLRKQPLRFSRRNFKGGGCMVWAAISSVGRVNLCFVSKRMAGAEYRICLRRRSSLSQSSSHNQMVGGQKDPHPGLAGLSLDMNIIENVWGYMVHKIYEGNKSYVNVAQLKRAIEAAWLTVDQQLIDNLYPSLDSRIFELTTNQGGHTSY